MKVSLKNSLIFLSAALAALFTGCASTPKGLTPSQAVGANHSPAALYMITFSDNAKDFPKTETAEKVSNYLKASGGFSFVDQDRTNEITRKTIEKLEKKAKRKNVADAIFGQKSAWDAITFDATKGIDAKDIFSAISKELKCKYFVKVNVKAGVRTTKTAVKPVAETAVYIYNKKNELKKEIHGVVSIPPVLRETITDKNQITEMFPELIERSIQLASENLNHKDKLFEIKALKENTLELVTDKEWPISYAKWE